MGFFSFLSRKSRRDKAHTRVGPKSYSSTASGLHHDQDGCSLDGTDPPVADSATSRPPANFIHSQPCLDNSSDDEVPAPAPSIPRFREGSLERPSTAPNVGPSSILLPSSGLPLKPGGQRRPPPLSFRTTRLDTGATQSRPGSRGSIASISSVLRRTPGRTHAISLQSDGNRAFKDILDAQSEIKPADFRERVKAAGVRDYGEDVAERNMAESVIGLGSNQVRAFYAESKGVESSNQSLSNRPPLSPHKAGVRRLSLRSNQSLSTRRVSSQSPLLYSPKALRSSYSGRRRSVITYMPPGSGDWGFLARSSPDRFGDLPPGNPVREIGRLESGFSTLRLNSHTLPHLPEAAPAPIIRTHRFPRDSVELAKKRAEESVGDDVVKHDSPATDFALWSASRSRRSSTLGSATSNTGKHRNFHSLRSSVSTSVLSQDSTHATRLFHPLRPATRDQHQKTPERPGRQGLMGAMGNAGASTSMPSLLKLHKDEGQIHRPSSRSVSLVQTKQASSTADVTLPDDDILDYPPPIRTRSMRGWSASSGTPTVSESTIAASITTSNLNRPHSLHTADTSVDLSVGAGSPVLKHAKSTTHESDPGSDADGGNPHAENTMLRSDTACGDACNVDDYLSASSTTADDSDPPHHPVHDDKHNSNTINLEKSFAADTFNIDDYLSSDAESLTAATTRSSSRRPTAEGEEELLFNEGGYGAAGMQLPGLPELLRSDVDGEGTRNGSGTRRGIRAATRTSLGAAPAPGQTALLDVSWEGSRSYSGMGLGIMSYVSGGRGRGASGVATKGMKKRTEGYRRGERRVKRLALNTGLDDEDDESAWDEGVTGSESRGGAIDLDGEVSDGGYEADYVEDEFDGMFRRRHHGKKRMRRLSAPRRHEETGREQQHQGLGNHGEAQRHQGIVEEKTPEDKNAAAVKLRKQIKTARRLAGQPSAAVLRRREQRVSVPVLRIDEAL
ncbi:hypothetical protein N657DRAFT_299212 [Parathielavia appendiculata]|uniref:Uncharacterized protein n=1 Tax=Parathielavia appendiculata TaxID=2587402 RepID=A0AAN6U743_9PEZI|nr:hypothetical protein N657DRAFT_299212 [Parathielavia appendiculata]